MKEKLAICGLNVENLKLSEVSRRTNCKVVTLHLLYLGLPLWWSASNFFGKMVIEKKLTSLLETFLSLTRRWLTLCNSVISSIPLTTSLSNMHLCLLKLSLDLECLMEVFWKGNEGGKRWNLESKPQCE